MKQIMQRKSVRVYNKEVELDSDMTSGFVSEELEMADLERPIYDHNVKMAKANNTIEQL
jgi:hypothetical protein